MAGTVEAEEAKLRGMKGIYGKVEMADSKFSATIGIDFLSLQTTIDGFESQGMTCVTAPQSILFLYSFSFFCNRTIVSTFAVQGNWSTATAFTASYPLSKNTSRSLTRLVGLQEMYTIRSTP